MVFHGVNVNWGVATKIQYCVGAFQTRDHARIADNQLIFDPNGTPVSKIYFNYREDATFTYVAIGYENTGNASYGGTLTTALQNLNNSNIGGGTTVYTPEVGQFVTVTDNNYGKIAGNWMVDEIKIISSNTNATRVSLKLSRYLNTQGQETVQSIYG